MNTLVQALLVILSLLCLALGWLAFRLWLQVLDAVDEACKLRRRLDALVILSKKSGVPKDL